MGTKIDEGHTAFEFLKGIEAFQEMVFVATVTDFFTNDQQGEMLVASRTEGEEMITSFWPHQAD